MPQQSRAAAARLPASLTMSYRSNTLRVLCPVSSMASRSATLGRPGSGPQSGQVLAEHREKLRTKIRLEPLTPLLPRLAREVAELRLEARCPPSFAEDPLAAVPAVQMGERQRLANSLHRRVRVQGGWAPEDFLGVVQTMPVSKGGFGGLDIWLREGIVGTQYGQYVIASLLALREHPSADRRTMNEAAVKNLGSVGWTAQAAEAARASCPGASIGGGER